MFWKVARQLKERMQENESLRRRVKKLIDENKDLKHDLKEAHKANTELEKSIEKDQMEIVEAFVCYLSSFPSEQRDEIWISSNLKPFSLPVFFSFFFFKQQ